ncbi:MAG: carbamate kinase [Actinomycetota bacterium]
MARLVIALGGNALLQRREPLTVESLQRNVVNAVTALAPLAAMHQLIVTHGNGPQVGLLALQAEVCTAAPPYPLDVLGAETEGQIGYLIERELRNQLPGREVATLLTQVVVDACDPAFATPSKPIGPGYSRDEAARLTQERGWRMLPDGDRFRRGVPSPEPRRILELGPIRLLADAGVIVVCAGGGGIPVAHSDDGAISGVEAVIDKDLASSLLAIELDADALLLLTDVEAIFRGWGTAGALPLRGVHPAELRQMDLAIGSMAPKAEAACRFVEATGRSAGIGRLQDAAAILRGERGTRVSRFPTGRNPTADLHAV